MLRKSATFESNCHCRQATQRESPYRIQHRPVPTTKHRPRPIVAYKATPTQRHCTKASTASQLHAVQRPIQKTPTPRPVRRPVLHRSSAQRLSTAPRPKARAIPQRHASLGLAPLQRGHLVDGLCEHRHDLLEVLDRILELLDAAFMRVREEPQNPVGFVDPLRVIFEHLGLVGRHGSGAKQRLRRHCRRRVRGVHRVRALHRRRRIKGSRREMARDRAVHQGSHGWVRRRAVTGQT